MRGRVKTPAGIITFPCLPNRFFKAAALVFEDRPLTHTFREELQLLMTPEHVYTHTHDAQWELVHSASNEKKCVTFGVLRTQHLPFSSFVDLESLSLEELQSKG